VQYKDLAVDIHHIFPYAWCLTHNIDPEQRESIVNKTPLSAETNRAIGGSAPSEYLRRVETKASISDAQVDAHVATHLIEPTLIRADDFHWFFRTRLTELTILIEKATGKPVLRDWEGMTAVEGPDQFDPEDDAVKPDLDDLDG
jgi:hypothetical protein